ncbi:rhodanese-like domain-containing protein [Micrococcus sp. SIMBA_144]
MEKSKEYIMVCRSGGRSGQAAQFLENQGFDVINMTGGMMSWEGPTE